MSEPISLQELQLAARNHGMPLEALRYDVTPVGLHYLLVHYDIPAADADSWTVEVGGLVSDPLSLSMADIRSRPAVRMPVTFECAGNGRAFLDPRPVSQPWLLEAVGTAEWTGTPLRDVLREAGVDPSAVEIVFMGADHGVEGGVEQTYERSLSVSDCMRDDVLLAYEVNGQPLPPQHGFPLRLVVPGWYGMTNVKWLRRITAVAEPFTGYQNVKSYRYRLHEDEPGEPVTRMVPRSLMVPPGVPEFLSRKRVCPPGTTAVTGRAWSGQGDIVAVEFSSDDARTWTPAHLGPQIGPAAWRSWTAAWEAEPGEHVLACRATDSAGNVQPLEVPWNVGGYANNSVHRVPVEVRA